MRQGNALKKASLLLLALSLVSFSFAHSCLILPGKKLYANEIFIPVGKNGEKISLQDLSQMKVKQLEAITGKKMKLKEKIGFVVAQKQLRNSINADGTINNKRFAKRMYDDEGWFHFGGFALGFFLGIIGVLIAYLINDHLKHSRVSSAWLGLAAWVAVWSIVILLVKL